MKSFFLKICLFAFVVITIVWTFLHFNSSYVDFFYNKVISPPQFSMITGDSKSLMGIRPDVVDKEMEGHFKGPMFNMSLTANHVAYGDVYLNTIRKKLDKTSKNGLFILNVNPWLLSERDTDDFKNGVFFEKDLAPHNLWFMSMNPNPEYVIRNFNMFNLDGFINKEVTVHLNGWMEKKDLPSDSLTERKLNQHYEELYPAMAKTWKKSPLRVSKLRETIQFLNKYGTVILVRMPTGQNIVAIENVYWPHFNAEMQAVSKNNASHFINYADSRQFHTFDGIHLNKKNAAIFTAALCDSIKRIK